ncbi:MAG: DUF4091 domain-containing protein [Firmicutes bacterium]|nr:DUF4091 domain-containing protein [Bacillota bacterium]
MNITVKQLSSLKKVRSINDMQTDEICKKMILAGQSFSYQVAVYSDEKAEIEVEIDSSLSEYIRLYAVRDTVMDYTADPEVTDTDFLTREPGTMPDLLVPIEEQNGIIHVSGSVSSIWTEIKLPHSFSAGKRIVSIGLTCRNIADENDCAEFVQTMEIEVIGADIPEQSTLFTQWFHTDCIAEAYNTEIYSEKHWAMIDKFMRLASELGINMLLTPVITPPLDTKEGGLRPNTQLVKIEKCGEKYSFDFSRLDRWISLCRKNGIKYYEISHFFSQWGLKYAPKIYVTENGEESRMFGWHVPAKSTSYREFLEQFLPELIKELKKQGVEENCYVHLSDEPNISHLESYLYAYETIKPLIGRCKIMDALSDVDFYDSGLVNVPVTASDHIEPFLEKRIENQWIYYCCEQANKVGNRFMAMPSYRNRILGLQMYKYRIEGFLHWGFNFYNSRFSMYKINPYVTSSADKCFPSGDSFSMYPGKDGPLPSLRAMIFKEALEDIEICRLLEKYIGRENVIEIIEREADMKLTFSEYPCNDKFIPEVMEKIIGMIKKYI